jgi:hypothetical protein
MGDVACPAEAFGGREDPGAGRKTARSGGGQRGKLSAWYHALESETRDLEPTERHAPGVRNKTAEWLRARS